ncbi:sensor histidine kinase [Winogradskyella sp.]
MKYQLKQLCIVFILYYLVTDIIKELFDKGFTNAINYFSQGYIIVLTISVMCVLLLYVMTSYTAFWRFYNKWTLWKILTVIITVSFIIIGLRYLLEEVLFRTLFGFGNYKGNVSASYYILDNLYYTIQYVILGIIFYFWQYSKYNEQRSNQLLIENQQMELDLLRSQTNPHFLFNTLNNIYALVNIDTDKALSAIEKLSLLLRYSLYKTKANVTLEDEITQIKNFIDLESIRHPKKPQVKLDLKGDISNLKIPQFILLPFVENAVKHGNLQSETTPVTIKISIVENLLQYEVINEIEQKQKDKIGGLGLENLRKRLELLFPKRHSFECKAENGIFISKLKIPLK